MAAESVLVETLTTLLAEFDRRQVEYALAGGWAFSALVEPRATVDIDLLVLVDHPTQDIIRNLLSPVFASIVVHQAPMRFQDIAIWRAIGIKHGQEVVVDLLLAQSAYLRTALARRQLVSFGDTPISILALEDLILLKLMAGRLQDRADLEKIESRRGDLRVDWSYVAAWKAKLGLE
jgi:predicted nucleotidyltransferase